jgi:hypothetical protein
MGRVILYKITFEEIPHWYWGVHWEKQPNDGYLGSPLFNRRFWDWYTPVRTVCQEFEATQEGYYAALEVEKRVIRPDLNNPLCLNARVGGILSMDAILRGVALSHAERTEEGKSVRILRHNERLHAEVDESGRSIHGVMMTRAAHREKDEAGKSVHAKKMAASLHEEKREDGKSVHAVKAGQAGKGLLHWNNGVRNTKSRECPGEGWERGYLRKPS